MSIACEKEINSNLNNSVYLYNLQNRTFFPLVGDIILNILFVLIFVVNIVGNLSVWLAIPCRRTLRSPMNYLLLNLSLAHIISGINALMFRFVPDTGAIAKTQTNRNFTCAFTEGLCVYFIGAGTYLLTLCAISFNRYMAIQYPTRQGLRMQKRSIIIYNVIMWVFSTAWVLPSAISFRYHERIRLCLRDWRHIGHPFVYRITSLLWSIVLPITFLFLTFSAILWKRKEKNILLDRHSMLMRQLHLQRAEKMLGLLILTFLLTWLPFFIYWGLYTTGYFNGCSGEIDALTWLHVTLLFSMFNGALDPLLYTSGNKELKGAIYGILKKMVCQTGNRIDTSRDMTLRSNIQTAGISSTTVLPDVNQTFKSATKFELFSAKNSSHDVNGV